MVPPDQRTPTENLTAETLLRRTSTESGLVTRSPVFETTCGCPIRGLLQMRSDTDSWSSCGNTLGVGDLDPEMTYALTGLR